MFGGLNYVRIFASLVAALG